MAIRFSQFATGASIVLRAVGRPRLLRGVQLLLILGAITAFYLMVAPQPPYSPDSWSYYELSRTVGHDFFRITTWRSFQTIEPYSMSFPPLWPVVLATWNSMVPAGPLAGLLLNSLILVLTALIAERLFTRCTGLPGAGLASTAYLLADRSFMDEVAAGRTMPLQILLLLVLVAVLASTISKPARYGMAGIICGLMCLNRFDFTPVAAVVGMAVLIGSGLRSVAVFAAAFAIMLSPWIAFSLQHFGVLLASDNSAVVASIDSQRFVTDWVPVPDPTFWQQPVAWLAKLRANIPSLRWALTAGVTDVQRGALLGVFVALLMALPAVWLHRVRSGPSPEPSKRPLLLLWLAVLTAGYTSATVTYLATGYFDHRYFAPLRLLAFMVPLCALAWTLRSDIQRGLMMLSLLTLSIAATGPTLWNAHRLNQEFVMWPPSTFAHPPEDRIVEACIPPTDRVILFADNAAMAPRFGAVTGRPSAFLPHNYFHLDPPAQVEFLRRYRIGFIVHPETPKDVWPVPIRPLQDCPAASLQ